MRRIPPAHLFGVAPVRDELHCFETSWLLSPATLAGLRGLISIYIFASILAIWIFDGTHGDRAAIGQSFSYFTWLTYWGLGFYTLFAAIHGFCYAITGRSVLFDRWPRALRAMHAILYSSVTTLPFLVTIVFWGILYSNGVFKDAFTTWSNISQHALNSLYALLEIILATTAPHPWITLPFLILILLFYLCVVYITFHTEGFYTYGFLDTEGGNKSGVVAGYCFGILAAILVIFVISWAVIKLRAWLVKGRVKRAPKDPFYGQHRSSLEAGMQPETSEVKHERV
ncbi:hypothetical protein N7532_004442 [Penicillium argentinense]|uniref:Uncharacterized protein n=1 Tax=Penicillium argentinense TaxID=1131581 RepID=A0A9W9FPC6_9EURO|nr:uncharacterized protein N7532_004442 [Penicillium argentinense]KAJ5103913.1 hypothetical protein N7532_004442 [Penicillium argentinense]